MQDPLEEFQRCFFFSRPSVHRFVHPPPPLGRPPRRYLARILVATFRLRLDIATALLHDRAIPEEFARSVVVVVVGTQTRFLTEWPRARNRTVV